tara:strand:- start:41 stop:319 length:279 start_codon:yes stop_codon:yes gene_type:complete
MPAQGIQKSLFGRDQGKERSSKLTAHAASPGPFGWFWFPKFCCASMLLMIDPPAGPMVKVAVDATVVAGKYHCRRNGRQVLDPIDSVTETTS